MKNLISLKPVWGKEPATAGGGKVNIPNGAEVKEEHIEKLIRDLEKVKLFWSEEDKKIYGGALVSCLYDRIVPKSKRIKKIFPLADESIRGAKYVTDKGTQCHFYTYFVSLESLDESIADLTKVHRIVRDEFDGKLTSDDLANLSASEWKSRKKVIPLNRFLQLIVDCFFVRGFSVHTEVKLINSETVVTVYRTKLPLHEVLASAGLKDFTESDHRILNQFDVVLSADQYRILSEKKPYLIANAIEDFNDYNLAVSGGIHGPFTIKEPDNEPIIGVIDTGFDDRVYFKDWVEYIDKHSSPVPVSAEDLEHGTKVTSIIVDGPHLMPELEDNCGNFRVRNFGVARRGRNSSTAIMKQIREIVETNRDIKVWNISLGSPLEVDENFISVEAAELDRLQYEFSDILFVVAGTNKPKSADKLRLGSPADSINSLVVNACRRDCSATSYHRNGPVLSFFNKPDLSYFGGDFDERLSLCTATGKVNSYGTSYAAPWIARKAAYLIYVMKFSREVAKALLIDAAGGWFPNKNFESLTSLGYGVVPKKIEDVINSADDEIKFYMEGEVSAYRMSVMNLPVPLDPKTGKFPYFARATLCYFPNCKREHGVDYTLTEVDMLLGRLDNRKGQVEIKTINKNTQESDLDKVYEEEARQYFRKWDNVKVIGESLNPRGRARGNLGKGLWGLKLTWKERLEQKYGNKMRFGVVITLKHMYGEDRYKVFFDSCIGQGLLVNEIKIDERVEVHEAEQMELTFED
jgi:hypothetical protein